MASVAAVKPIANKSGKTFTRQEVAKHNKPGDCWVVVDTAVYDLSKFADLHPGGAAVIVSRSLVPSRVFQVEPPSFPISRAIRA